jgi:acetolactate synthase-1/2/3 large subunit
MFVGQVARAMRDREAFQELDYRAVFGTMASGRPRSTIPSASQSCVACVSCRDERPARPGGDRAARGHADGARLGRRCARGEPIETWPGLTDMSQLQKLLWAAEKPIAILGGSRWSERMRRDRTLRGAFRTAGRDLVSPYAAVCGDASVVCRATSAPASIRGSSRA